ncbi:hypothetical protein [Sanguibacter sp. HDW7]|uniref:hypothetical protein n=1 Tax=Sanguibacter sp. HDW7 TaxID=2714931 RepID=UPI00140E8374|nr:hypothetical protein [Sanguibacter sp. HDW7]QIK84268.1 hypothetical protein G7063_12060 [Sanguibacter sp. HDW7]
MLSTVLEPAARSARARGASIDSLRTIGAATRLSVLAALCGGGIALVAVGGPVPTILGAVACSAATFRSAARFVEVSSGDARRATRGDMVATVGLLSGAGIVAAWGVESVETLLGVWAGAMFAGATASTWPRLTRVDRLRDWFADHREDIRPLLRESLVMDAGAIGAPYAIAPFLGASAFGIYRAVSNVAAPTRLVMNPLRPLIVATPLRTLLSVRGTVTVAALAVVAGAGASAVLVLVDVWGVDLGSLSALARFALPTGIFVAASTVGHLAYLVCRAHSNPRELWFGRVAQSSVAFVVPVVGALLGGLDAAIWCYVSATVVGLVVWIVAIRRAVVRARSDEEGAAR